MLSPSADPACPHPEGRGKDAADWDLFAPHVSSADDVVAQKPAPDLFGHAAAGLGIDADRCLMIEDSINGNVAGRAAGMRIWGFTGGRHHDDDDGGAHLVSAGAERVVVDWAEATELLERP